MKKLPIGRENLKDIIEGDFYYVDKTKIIEELLERGAYITLFPRPRRFGKSLMLSTLDEFFNAEKNETNKNLFEDLYISKNKYYTERGKYPVIKLNFKSLQSNNWADMYDDIKEEIRQLFESKRYVIDVLNEEEKVLYNKFLSVKANLAEYKQSLKVLSQFLRRYFNEKPILLIDEYDVPIQKGYMQGFYKEIVDFIKSLFNNSLKANDSIRFAVMTGVLRVSKESIFSDLNNVKIYSNLEKVYDEYFGFTENETKELLEYYNLELTEDVKRMYDGYIFGNQEIYNPWSILNYSADKTLYPYWVNTSGDELLRDLFNKSKKQISEMLEKLILGESIHCKYDEKVTFLDLNLVQANSAKDLVANFLLISGYLTKADKNPISPDGYLNLKIPNNEVRTVYTDVISNWMLDDADLTTDELYNMKENLLNKNIKELEKTFNKALNHMSFYDENEGFYHGYMLGLFVIFLNRQYIVKSNREAGEGRFDIMIESVDRKDGIIVEFKIARENEDIEQKAKKGTEQIYEKEYYKELELEKVQNILIYSVAFQGKKCKVI